jgi:hypothetical protein
VRRGARERVPVPISFTDSQLDELFRLARPLQPQCRIAFMEILADKLRDRVDVGDGELNRIAREVIKANHLFQAPDDMGSGRWSRWRR